MLIEIDEKLYKKVLGALKKKHPSLHDKLKEIEPLQGLSQKESLAKAREIKTARIKETIKETLQLLRSENINPTRYQVHKRTKIAYVTLNKYFDEISEEADASVNSTD